ncbi:unnamed protein product [Thlaspi arvense]|uniref:C-JID domain-containing protein n=1 Tax=Thlaspi arvense TaxID=13288 RepID=A0AAU9RMI0_THLAR|nr:unnamed protein product [Thlaspi arvense]
MPSYFTHRTTGTSSSLTVPLLHNYLSQPFLRFRACLVFDYDTVVVLGRGQRYPSFVYFYFKGRFWNSFDSLGQPQDFRAGTNKYDLDSDKKETLLLITDCRIPLSKDSAIFAEMNYNHVDLQIHISSPSWYRIKEWGIRVLEDCSSSENQLGNPNTLPHVFEADQDNMLNEAAEQVEECGGEDKVKETSSKRMRIS